MRPPPVVLIPGLWLPGVALVPLARRLRRAGYLPYVFRYRSVRDDLRASAARLAELVARLPAGTVHLVGHSLGGIVIRALFHHFPDQPPGRIVTLATPHAGSRVAAHLAGRGWRPLLGRSVAELVAGAPPGWPAPAREIGLVSGARSLGLGRLFYRGLPCPNDGVLTVDETRLAGAREHLVLPVSHSGMVLSARVARQVAAFLADGRFRR